VIDCLEDPDETLRRNVCLLTVRTLMFMLCNADD